MNKGLTLTGCRGGPYRLDGLIGSLAARIRRWQRNHRTRQQLDRLDAHRLRDLGLADIDRRIECRKRFWQA